MAEVLPEAVVAAELVPLLIEADPVLLIDAEPVLADVDVVLAAAIDDDALLLMTAEVVLVASDDEALVNDGGTLEVVMFDAALVVPADDDAPAPLAPVLLPQAANRPAPAMVKKPVRNRDRRVIGSRGAMV